MFSTLLVEDNEAFRQMLTEILRAHFPGMAITHSLDGKAALSTVGDGYPDLVFMDIRLPGENGLELTRRIRQARQQTVIIILTGHDLPEYRQQAFRNGADCFLAKDSESCMEDILAQVEGAMARKRH